MRLLASLAVITFIVQPVHSSDKKSKVDFDQGPDAHSVLEGARLNAGVSAIPPLKVLMSVTRSERLRGVVVPPSLRLAVWPPSDSPTAACDAYNPENDGRPSGIHCAEAEKDKACPKGQTVRALLPQFLLDLPVPLGSVFDGPFGPLPLGGAVYREGASLKSRVHASPSIPADTRGALLNDWTEIDTAGSVLTNEGNGLDVDDEALYADAVRLNVWEDRINARLAIGRELLARYNQGCRSGPVPPDEAAACNRWASQFNACVNRHNAAVKRYQQAAAIWDENYDRLEPKVSGFRARVQGWENLKIKPFMEKAKKALAEACAPLVSVSASATPSTIVPRKTSILAAKPKYSDSTPDAKPCPTKFKWKPSITALGSLSSDAGQSVTFTSHGERGTQDLRVEASDDYSTKVAGTVVTIAGGKLCPVTRTYDPAEDKTTCAYACSTPTSPRIFPGNVQCPQMYDPE